MSFQYHERTAIARSLTRQGVFLDRANYNGVHKCERTYAAVRRTSFSESHVDPVRIGVTV